MNTINCLLVSRDEQDDALVKRAAGQSDSITLAGKYCSLTEAGRVLSGHGVRVDVILLDATAENMASVEEMRNEGRQLPLIVFLASHPDYALPAFHLHAVDYLLKPVAMDDLQQAFCRVAELLDLKAKALLYDIYYQNDVLIIKEGSKINRVPIRDVLYLEALTNYTKIVTSDKKYLTLGNLKHFLKKLPEQKFIRIHRSYAVAIDRVNYLECGTIFIGNHRLPLGKTYRSSISKAIIRLPELQSA